MKQKCKYFMQRLLILMIIISFVKIFFIANEFSFWLGVVAILPLIYISELVLEQLKINNK